MFLPQICARHVPHQAEVHPTSKPFYSSSRLNEIVCNFSEIISDFLLAFQHLTTKMRFPNAVNWNTDAKAALYKTITHIVLDLTFMYFPRWNKTWCNKKEFRISRLHPSSILCVKFHPKLIRKLRTNFAVITDPFEGGIK